MCSPIPFLIVQFFMECTHMSVSVCPKWAIPGGETCECIFPLQRPCASYPVGKRNFLAGVEISVVRSTGISSLSALEGKSLTRSEGESSNYNALGQTKKRSPRITISFGLCDFPLDGCNL